MAPERDPSVEHEPHLREAVEPADDVSAEPALALNAPSTNAAATSALNDDIDHTVWDEPSQHGFLRQDRPAGQAPEGALTFARWLDDRSARFTELQSWNATLLIAMAAGPWGVLGAIISQTGNELGTLGLLAATFVAPVTEEITKVATALWVVEKRPYWFQSAGQLMLCAAAGGLAFAAIENCIYIYVYQPRLGFDFRLWRWVVCTTLHLVCSLIAGMGLTAIWRRTMRDRTRPELAVGMPWFATAMVIHGLYNFTVTVAEAAGWLDFE